MDIIKLPGMGSYPSEENYRSNQLTRSIYINHTLDEPIRTTCLLCGAPVKFVLYCQNCKGKVETFMKSRGLL